MEAIHFIDRISRQKIQEKIYGFFFVYMLYGQYPCSSFFNRLLQTVARIPFISYLYGKIQDTRWSRRKVLPFIQQFEIDMGETLKRPSQYQSFNDFFYRKLKPGARSFPKEAQTAIMPADGRYLFIPNISKRDGFYVKGHRFQLASFLKDEALSERFEKGVMIVARLCPTDYHRFHFPCSGIAEKPKMINGYLNAVNLASLKNNIHVFSENKRMITLLNTERFGQVAYIEIGAVCVGSIIQTFEPNKLFQRGDEKGYFAFGGSCVVMLFEENRLMLDKDLLKAPNYLEMRCKFGQSLGTSL